MHCTALRTCTQYRYTWHALHWRCAPAPELSSMLLFLQVWIGLVAVAALGNSLQCFVNQQFPRDRIYDLQPSQATELLSRMFSVWTLLASVVRFAFVISPHNKSLFVATLISFLLAFFHFTSEVFIYHTASPSFGSISPVMVSGVSVLWMTFIWPAMQFVHKTKKKET